MEREKKKMPKNERKKEKPLKSEKFQKLKKIVE